MSPVPVKYVHQDHLRDRQYPLDIAFDGVIPVVELAALREVVEGLKRDVENGVPPNDRLGYAMGLSDLLTQIGEVGK